MIRLGVKRRIQTLVDQHPWVKRTRFYYKVQHFRQMRPCTLNPALTSRRDLLDAIVRDGVCLVPGAVSAEICQKIIAELEAPLQELAAGTYQGKATRHAVLDAYRLGDVDQLSPTARDEFFNLPLVNDMAKAYVSPQAWSYRRECDYKSVDIHGDKQLQSELPHFDDWRHRFKAFLYLTDVTEENAPFVFYTGTHAEAPWKERYLQEFERDGEQGRYGYFFPQEMHRLMKEHGFQERVFTAPAGSLIFVDTRGVHRGTTLRAGRRILLNATFGISLDGII
jgi:hypothetical protein